MTCRVCGADAPVVKTTKANDHVVRRHKCNRCEHEFRTLEMDEDMWGSFSKTKKLEEVTSTIREAIIDYLKTAQSGSAHKMAVYVAGRLFAEVKNEM